MKRLFVAILTLLLLLSPTPVMAEEGGLAGEAKSVLLMEASTGKVLYEKDADLQLPPASVTKIMTILLIM